MPIKVFNTFNNSVAFPHVWTSPQRDGVTLFASAKLFVRLMGVAPRGAPVDKSLELPRNIRPVGGGYGYDEVCPFIKLYDAVRIVALNTFRRMVAASAPFAKMNVKVVDTDASHIISLFEAVGYHARDFGGRSGSHRTAIHH